MPLRSRTGQVVDEDEWKAMMAEDSRSVWSTPVGDFPSGAFPAYRLGERASEHAQDLKQALPSDEFIRELCKDARDLVIGCAVHVCSNSCYKYHSNKISHICRHNFYHVVCLADEEWNQIKRRRQGKPLRACVGIFRDTRYGMAGRIVTYQVHPNECPTNYIALAGMRCNVDVQDFCFFACASAFVRR